MILEWGALLLLPLAAAPRASVLEDCPPPSDAPAVDKVTPRLLPTTDPSRPPDALPPESTELYTPPVAEFWVRTESRIDIWEGPHVTFGLGLSTLFDLTDERSVRLGFHTNFLWGTWADNEDRGDFIIEHGPEMRLSLYMDEVLDIFVMARTLGVLGVVDDVHWGVRPGLGLGMRLGRYASVNLNGEPVWTLGEPLVEDGQAVSEHLPSGGIGLELGVNLCLFSGLCDQTTPTPVTYDETDKLYALARAFSCSLSDADLATFCTDAVKPALDASEHHEETSADRDGIGPFLRGLIDRVEDPQRSQLRDIREHHAQLRSRQRANEAYGLVYARDGRRRAQATRYEPVVLELRRQLGCDPRDPPRCSYPHPGWKRCEVRRKQRALERHNELIEEYRRKRVLIKRR